jgi:hypothetical protein
MPLCPLDVLSTACDWRIAVVTALGAATTVDRQASVSFTRALPLLNFGHLSCFPLLHFVVGSLLDHRRPTAASPVDQTSPTTAASTPLDKDLILQ